MGCCADEYLIENDIKEIQRTLSEMFDYHCRMSYPLNTSLREIRFAAEAEFNIVLRQEALPAAIWMKERFNIPYVFSDCYGIQEMKNFSKKFLKSYEFLHGVRNWIPLMHYQHMIRKNMF